MTCGTGMRLMATLVARALLTSAFISTDAGTTTAKAAATEDGSRPGDRFTTASGTVLCASRRNEWAPVDRTLAGMRGNVSAKACFTHCTFSSERVGEPARDGLASHPESPGRGSS